MEDADPLSSNLLEEYIGWKSRDHTPRALYRLC